MLDADVANKIILINTTSASMSAFNDKSAF